MSAKNELTLLDSMLLFTWVENVIEMLLEKRLIVFEISNQSVVWTDHGSFERSRYSRNFLC